MSFFLLTDDEQRALATEHACMLDVSPAASELRRHADRQEDLGMPRSAAVLRELAQVRNEDAS